MEWNFMGKGSAFYPPFGNTGAYMLLEKELYLLDCGERAFDHLYYHVDLEAVENVYVILTHLHADHVGSLGTLISYFYCLRGKRIHVIHPEETVIRLLILQGLETDAYQFSREMPENKAGLRAVPVKVQHVENMECYGYLLSDGKETIYYSGDARDIPVAVKRMLLPVNLQGSIRTPLLTTLRIPATAIMESWRRRSLGNGEDGYTVCIWTAPVRNF